MYQKGFKAKTLSMAIACVLAGGFAVAAQAQQNASMPTLPTAPSAPSAPKAAAPAGNAAVAAQPAQAAQPVQQAKAAQPSGAVVTPIPVSAPIPPAALPPLPQSQPGYPVQQPGYVGTGLVQAQNLDEPNFDQVLDDTLVLNPSQIRETRRQANARMRAAQELPQTPPKPVTSLISASPAAGSPPPVVRLFPGFASSIVMTDASGAPWPIENYAVGHKDNFEVKRLDGVGGSVLSIVPLQYYASSNMILNLKGLPSPIVIQFIAGQKEVDFRTDVRVQGKGPNTQLSVAGLPQSANTQLLSVLEGVPPEGSKPLKVGMQDAQAWVAKNGRMFLKTSLPVISPSWLGSVRSTDGSSAYEMMPSSSLLVMKDGQIRQITVEGW